MKKNESLRINCTVYGKPSLEAKELKREGIVRNNADLVRQGIGALYQRVVEERLKTLRMKALENTSEDENR